MPLRADLHRRVGRIGRAAASPGSRRFADQRAQDATELMVRLLRERDAYEANLFGENNPFLVAASIFPYFYALAGERNPRQAPQSGPRSEYSNLACDTFAAIQRGGPISKAQAAGDARRQHFHRRARSRAGRAGREAAHHPRRLQPSGRARSGMCSTAGRRRPCAKALSFPSARRFPRCFRNIWTAWSAADQQELEALFGNFVSRSRVKDALNGLEAAREVEFIRVGKRSLIQITPPKAPVVPRANPVPPKLTIPKPKLPRVSRFARSSRPKRAR